jgi:hypothetical protein
MGGPELYALCSSFLAEVVRSTVDHGAVRVRIVDDAHPEVHILAATGGGRAVRLRALRVPRHADGTLAMGFAEVYPGQLHAGLGA